MSSIVRMRWHRAALKEMNCTQLADGIWYVLQFAYYDKRVLVDGPGRQRYTIEPVWQDVKPQEEK